jgi:nucleoside-diphosphate-sugar epimerase
MITILGAGGSVGDALVKLLAARGAAFRLVSRSGSAASGAAEAVAADLGDREQTARAVSGSRVVVLLAGLKYDHNLWAEMWPRIMTNTIEACKRAGARLVFYDNLYMYGRVSGVMTEETPFRPTSRKGEVRAKIATDLVNEWQSGALTGMIARAADFYGPGAKNGIPNALVFEPMSKGQTPMCLATDALPHSYSYVPDSARALVTLMESEPAWNQTWHMPTSASPPTGREFIEMAAKEMGRPVKYRVLSRAMVQVFGWFKPQVGEVREMMYQNESPYLFDSTKYARAFGFAGTTYAEGIRATANSYKGSS